MFPVTNFQSGGNIATMFIVMGGTCKVLLDEGDSNGSLVYIAIRSRGPFYPPSSLKDHLNILISWIEWFDILKNH